MEIIKEGEKGGKGEKENLSQTKFLLFFSSSPFLSVSFIGFN